MTARRAALQWGVVPAMLISLTVPVGSVVFAPQASVGQASMASSSTSLSGPVSPVTAYVVNAGSGTVTPIVTASNTADPPIPVGSGPQVVAITPDGKTAYVVNAPLGLYGSGTVTPIATATNTAGPPIPVGHGPDDIAITPDGKMAYVVNANDVANGP